MTNQERIIATGLCQQTDRVPFFFYFGPWDEAVARWRTEGMPADKQWTDLADFDPGIATVWVNLGYHPRFEQKVLEDKGDTKIIVDERGVTQEIRSHGYTIPRYIDYPVKDRETWEQLKAERLDPEKPGRFPANFDEMVQGYIEAGKALQLGYYPYGLFGTLRDMMGAEELLMSFCYQPDLVHDMMDYLTDFWLAIYEKVCARCQIDIIHIWEDMSGKTGSLISPAMVREFMAPNYRRIRDFADTHGIKVVGVDTDGDPSQLILPFMESGINLMMPFEVRAGSDIVKFRRQYPDLAIMGGIDKLEIGMGKAAIDAEMERVKPMFDKPGYFPAMDHLIPPEISYPDFMHFLERLRVLCRVK